MSNYRRWYVEGGTYFFTLVTHKRRPIFHNESSRGHPHRAFTQTQTHLPWDTCAIVLLPDHLHMLWTLPADDVDYSGRIGRLKKAFTEMFLNAGGQAGERTAGEKNKRYGGVWQPKFWEHTIRDARDFKMHLDYIHINPVKHGLASLPTEWPWSSFHRWCGTGEYDTEWCGRVDLPGSVEYYQGE